MALIDSTIWTGGVDRLDGTGDMLDVHAVSPAGFWGQWHLDPGIAVPVASEAPDPAGHFCAWRVAPRGADGARWLDPDRDVTTRLDVP